MEFKLKPGMIVRNLQHGATCIVLDVGNDGHLTYRTQMYVLQSDLFIDGGYKKTFWVNSIMADDKYEVLYECPTG